MKRFLGVFLGVTIACALVFVTGCGDRVAGPADAPSTPSLSSSAVPGQFIVEVAPGWSAGQINVVWGTSTLAVLPQSNFVLLRTPPGTTPEALMAQLVLAGAGVSCQRNHRIGSAEAQQGSIAFYEGNLVNQDLADQDAMTRVRAEQASARENGNGVTVAILDTGVDATHPALAGRVLPGWDFVAVDSNPDDEADGLDQDVDGIVDEGAGHGTHLAGIINFIAPGASLLPVRVLDSEGNGTIFSVAQGIHYAMQQGARVINLSLAIDDYSSIVEWAIETAHAQGILVVASAGNGSAQTETHFPASMPEVLAVAALDAQDLKATFSNYGSIMSVGAPGVGIVSTYRFHGYAIWSGTSMSAAFVSGAGALGFGAEPASDPDELRALIEDVAPVFSHGGQVYEGLMGAGRLDLLGIVFHPIATES